jgi:hypothetical protein
MTRKGKVGTEYRKRVHYGSDFEKSLDWGKEAWRRGDGVLESKSDTPIVNCEGWKHRKELKHKATL